MASSRLERGEDGTFAVLGETSIVGKRGTRLRVIGNCLESNGLGCGWLGERTGRSPTPAERATWRPRPPGRQPSPRPEADELVEELSLELQIEEARVEQERAPSSPIDTLTRMFG